MVKKWLILTVVLLPIGVLSVPVALSNPDLTAREELEQILLSGPDFAWSPISTPEFIFSPHEEGTAVWTGTEMIIWGGDYGSDGIRYELATDTWRWINPYNQPVPCPQTGHTALWTGSAMLILGGWGFYIPGNCDISANPRDQWGGWYYPATNSWVTAGWAGYYHTSVWTGSEVIMWGGKLTTGLFNDGTRWNPQNNTFVAIPSPAGFGQRHLHSAVWTGSEMIVWGGAGPGGHYSDGIHYNPVTAVVATISPVGAPSARFGHTAVWTGSEMIVWGGSYGSYNFFSDGARYEPNSDSWTTISALNAPTGRYMHTAVWTGTEMIVFGGRNGAEVFGDGASYNPSTDTWIPLPSINAPTARFGHTAVWTGDEMIVHGGTAADFVPLADGARYKLLADLIIAGMTNPPADLDPGQEFKIIDSTMNVGPGLSGRSVTGYYFSKNRFLDKKDVRIGFRDVLALQPDGISQTETTVQVPDDLKPGYYYIIACANDLHSEVETDETNNCFRSFTRARVRN